MVYLESQNNLDLTKLGKLRTKDIKLTVLPKGRANYHNTAPGKGDNLLVAFSFIATNSGVGRLDASSSQSRQGMWTRCRNR